MLGCFFLFMSSTSSFGFMMIEQESIDKIYNAAEVVAKVEVISTAESDSSPDFIADDYFRDVLASGFYRQNTAHVKIISLIKGTLASNEFRYQYLTHVAIKPEPPSFWRSLLGRKATVRFEVGAPTPSYELESGKHYILFGTSEGEPSGVYRQLTKAYYPKDTDSVFLAADGAQTAEGADIKKVIFDETVKLLRTGSHAEKLKAISVLEVRVTEFRYEEVMPVLAERLPDEDPEVEAAALTYFRRDSPYAQGYRGNDDALFEAARKGNLCSEYRFSSEYCPPRDTVHKWATLYAAKLIEVANNSKDSRTRASAISALGCSGDRAVNNEIEKWLQDPEAAVRAAAILVSSEYPGKDLERRVQTALKDPDGSVRAAAVRAAVYGHLDRLKSQLPGLLNDTDKQVVESVKLVLSRFPEFDQALALGAVANDPKQEVVALTKLMLTEPERYYTKLSEALLRGPGPLIRVPNTLLEPYDAGVAALLRFLYLKPAEQLRKPNFSVALDALQYTGTYPVGLLYAFLRQRGLHERADAYMKGVAQRDPTATFDFGHIDAYPDYWCRDLFSLYYPDLVPNPDRESKENQAAAEKKSGVVK
jgi:hypothetical protein